MNNEVQIEKAITEIFVERNKIAEIWVLSNFAGQLPLKPPVENKK